MSETATLLDAARSAVAEGDSRRAVTLLTRLLDSKDVADAYYMRGREHFRLAQIEESLRDLDRYVQLRPEMKSRQWERGISCYYASAYEAGAAQFALYQTFHGNDVENGVWHFLCQAQIDGVDAARQKMLDIRSDSRVPMLEIYELFRGRTSVDRVLERVEQGDASSAERNRRRFYAHLYIGLYYEALGRAEDSLRHAQLAAERYPIAHYMADVARVHVWIRSKRNDDPHDGQRRGSASSETGALGGQTTGMRR